MKRLILIFTSLILLLSACDTSEVCESSYLDQSQAESVVSNTLSEASDAVSDISADESDENDLPVMLLGGKYEDYVEDYHITDKFTLYLHQNTEFLYPGDQRMEVLDTDDGAKEITISGSYYGFEFDEAKFQLYNIEEDGDVTHRYIQHFPDPYKPCIYIHIDPDTGVPCGFEHPYLNWPDNFLSEEEFIDIAKKFIAEYSAFDPDLSEYDININLESDGANQKFANLKFEKKINGICVDAICLKIYHDGNVYEFFDSEPNGFITSIPDYSEDDYIEASIKKLYDLLDGRYEELGIIKVTNIKRSSSTSLVYTPDLDICAICVKLDCDVVYTEDASNSDANETDSYRTIKFYFPFDPEDYE